MKPIDDGLIGAGNLIQKTGEGIIKNAGKIIAVIAAFLAVLLTFADVSFSIFGNERFVSNLVLVLIAAYVIYFSLEEAGESLAEESKEYARAIEEHGEAAKKIPADKIDALREFCIDYSRREAEYRRRGILIGSGHTEDELRRWRRGERFPLRARRAFRKAERVRSVLITPAELLLYGTRRTRSELINPTRRKSMKMLLRLLPTTVCTALTVSVMLTMKDGLTAATVIEGLLKLGTLPVVAFKGYTAGYAHVMGAAMPWVKTKTKLLSAFLKSEHFTSGD